MTTPTRQSPSDSATLYKIGTKRRGNDGNIWIIIETKNGIKRWKLYKKTQTTSKISKYPMVLVFIDYIKFNLRENDINNNPIIIKIKNIAKNNQIQFGYGEHYIDLYIYNVDESQLKIIKQNNKFIKLL